MRKCSGSIQEKKNATLSLACLDHSITRVHLSPDTCPLTLSSCPALFFIKPHYLYQDTLLVICSSSTRVQLLWRVYVRAGLAPQLRDLWS